MIIRIITAKLSTSLGIAYHPEIVKLISLMIVSGTLKFGCPILELDMFSSIFKREPIHTLCDTVLAFQTPLNEQNGLGDS